MRQAAITGVALAALLFAAGCPDKDKNASIEAANQGVEAYAAQQYSSASEHFGEATKLYAENHQAWYGLGQVHSKQKDWEQAAEAFSEAVKYRKDDAMYRMWLGIASYEAGNLEQAQTNLEEGVKLNPDLYRAYWYLGQIHRDENRPKEAAEAWTKAAALNPYYGPPFYRLGELYLTWDKIDEAVSVLEQGTLHVKEDRELTNVYYYLGLAYEAKQQWDKAIEAYSKAIDMRSDNLDAKFQRGLVYAKKGDTSKARADLEEYGKAGGSSSFNKTEANKVLMQLISE